MAGFKLAQSPTFKARVVVQVPNDKGGFDANEFVAEFARVSTAERKDMAGLDAEQLVRRVLRGWDMKDEAGNAVPFDADTLEAALAIQPTPLATAMAFWESLNGARAKN